MNKKYEPQKKYDQTHTRRYQLKLNLITDNDIIEKLNNVPSIQGYIKACIRESMKSEE